MSRNPDDVTEIGRNVERYGTKTLEWHPVISTIDHRLTHRAEARVGVGNPFERLGLDTARHCDGLLQSFGTKCACFITPALRLRGQRLQQQRQPRQRLSQHEWRAHPL